MNYRKDIDGLRAVAVLPVILYHAGASFLQGGFLGVDVFFVISGFLITTILHNELANKKYSLVNFYERRARRILPALFMVLLCTYIASFLFLSPFEFKEFSQSLVATIFFASNIFFYTEIDYFSITAEQMPLLHTWSLAIEEQYYLFFPLFLAAVFSRGMNFVIKSLTFIAILSFTSLMLLNNYGYYSESFYLLIPRSWELLAGSVCALLIIRRAPADKPKSNYYGTLGLALVILSYLFYPKGMQHPNALLVIPVLGICLIILFGEGDKFCRRILENSLFVYVGLMSYSLYLWHQPVFALVRAKSIAEPNFIVFSIAIITVLALSIFSYKYIESPFRNRKKFRPTHIAIFATLGSAIFICLGIYGHVSNGTPERYVSGKNTEYVSTKSPRREECHASDNNRISSNDACTYNVDKPNWASLGDSHLVELSHSLSEVLITQEQGLVHYTYSGCVPILKEQTNEHLGCQVWLDEALQLIINNPNVTDVMIGFRYSLSLFGENVGSYPQLPDEPNFSIHGNPSLTNSQLRELYWEEYASIIESLTNSGKRVHVLLPVPELPVHPNKWLLPFWIFSDTSSLDIKNTVSKEYYEKRNKFILNKLSALTSDDSISVINTYKLLCDETGCPVVHSDDLLYFDSNHLSVEGSDLLLKRYFEQKK